MTIVERYAPGFTASVIDRQMLSPVDIEETFGLTGGNIFQGTMPLHKLFMFRPVPGYADYTHADQASLPVRLGGASRRRRDGRAGLECRARDARGTPLSYCFVKSGGTLKTGSFASIGRTLPISLTNAVCLSPKKIASYIARLPAGNGGSTLREAEPFVDPGRCQRLHDTRPRRHHRHSFAGRHSPPPKCEQLDSGVRMPL